MLFLPSPPPFITYNWSCVIPFYPSPHTRIMLDWFVIPCLSHSRIFYFYRDVTIANGTFIIDAYFWRLQNLSRRGSLSCHTRYDKGPTFSRSPLEVRAVYIESPFPRRQRVLRTYSRPYPHGSRPGIIDPIQQLIHIWSVFV